MSLLTADQLTQELIKAADILRGVDPRECLEIISGVLLLKRVSDQPGILVVPEHLRWPHIVDESGASSGHVLNDALRQLEHSNPELLNGVLQGIDISRLLGPIETQKLIAHFSQIPLRDIDLEFSDVVGRAYDRALGWFAHQEGKRGGEFYTPRSVIQLMVRLVRPEEGQSVYDPFAGSAGMLIHAKQYVDEHSKGGRIALFGQEKNSFTRSIAQLNLLLHGVLDGSVLYGDTLSDPLHMAADGQHKLFDRVLTNPPFSMNHADVNIRYPERMRYGWTPGKGGKADLMNVQHVLSTLDPDGIGAVVAPMGILFRGGTEAKIRQAIVEDDRLEAVIGIGANVFHGTAIPACVLVLRGTNGPSADHRGRVLFINAEREVVTGRTQNRLDPSHIEKIINVFQNWSEVPAFSRVASLDELSDNDFNLNIRRYVNTNPPDEQRLNVRAALFGGIPSSDVEAEERRFRSFGIDLFELFEPKDSGRLGFLPEGYKATAQRIQELSASREQEFGYSCHMWWELTGSRIAKLAGTEHLLELRPELMKSFCTELVRWGILDQYELMGVFADWWSDHQDDLRSLGYRGFQGIIERWAKSQKNLELHVSDKSAHQQALNILGNDLCARAETLVFEERQALVETFRSWGERYATSLADLEGEREAAAVRLTARLEDLGYT